MVQKDFIRKDIRQNLDQKTVIDKLERIPIELTEYIITELLIEEISKFFSSYCDPYGARSIWISGSCGSGKSHLLEVLSLILENKEVNKSKPIEIIAEKIINDHYLKTLVLRAATIPSESILINCLNENTRNCQQGENEVLSMFYTAFNKHIGYYDENNQVAELERWLDGKGLGQQFQVEFEKAYSKSWYIARSGLLDQQEIAQVLSGLFGETADAPQNIPEYYRLHSSYSEDDFCKKVEEYISTKPKGFRLNFFIDDIGMCIAGKHNLVFTFWQIVQRLTNKGNGHSLIIATSEIEYSSKKAMTNDNWLSKIENKFDMSIYLRI